MDKQLSINLVYGNKTYIIDLSKSPTYDEFISTIFFKVTSIKEPTDKKDQNTFSDYLLNRFDDNFILTWMTKLITKNNWDEIKCLFEPDDTIFISNKLKGGFFSVILVIIGIFAILGPIIKPIGKMFEVIITIFGLVGKFIELLFQALDIIPLIFDPPKLMDDILFAVTTTLTVIFKKFTQDIKNIASSPEDEEKENGIFGVKMAERNAFSCMDPSWSEVLLLVLCPPLAIIYKLGFIQGLISSIICGVLCVKLYYFPGLLFAILHVLC
jgi:hypothetical protein